MEKLCYENLEISYFNSAANQDAIQRSQSADIDLLTGAGQSQVRDLQRRQLPAQTLGDQGHAANVSVSMQHYSRYHKSGQGGAYRNALSSYLLADKFELPPASPRPDS